MNKEKSKTILLVEDDKNLSYILSSVLSRNHYFAEIANNGKAGFRKYRRMSHDLIILDLGPS